MDDIVDEECNIDNEDIIDNEHQMLVDHLRSALPETKRVSIAVGYFFISGFYEIMDSFTKIENSKDPNDVIRLLISPTTNRITAESLLIGNENFNAVKTKLETHETTKEQEVRSVRDQIKETLEYMPQTIKDQAAAKKIRELIQKKKLLVKVYTREQLHAKAYIFELDNASLPKMAIVGSSNLSISGIREHTELNLKTKSSGDVNGLLQWFDCHWNDKSCQEFTEDIADILDKSWAGIDNTPDDVYGKASWYEHGKMIPIPLPDDDSTVNVELFDFQKKAVGEALKKLERYNGVIIADVVGTGKSYIGSYILKYLREYKHVKPLVICPPHLIEMWEKLLNDFDIAGEVESRFRIGMDDNVLRHYEHCDAILIDESHNFRHHDTNAYAALLAFMEKKTDEATMIMLTATPISNTIHDLKNQLKLFPVEGIEKIPLIRSTKLDDYFAGLEDKTRKVSPEGVIKIQELLKHVLIRRTRTQIIKYAKQDGDGYYMDQKEGRKYFPARKLQNPEEYDADKVYNNAFEPIEEAIKSLHLARYVPGKYIKKEYLTRPEYEDLVHVSKPMSGIVRTSLLKRMESSIKAFDTSIKNYQNGYRLFKTQLERDVVPIGKEFKDAIYKKIDGDHDYEDYEKDIENIKSKYNIKAFDVDLWKKEIDEDLNKFAEIVEHLSGEEYTKRDDKLHKLYDLIKDKNEKILIFSESAETVEYIYNYLKDEITNKNIEYIHSKRGQSKKTSWIKRFDPEHNRARNDISKDDEIDILISTDVLAEGVNLHAGKTIINYDFHWNPVRLIQRVGRLDRIGSKHKVINIFNFLPTTKIDKSLSLKDRVSEKIKTIRRIIGTDQKILEVTENLDEKAVSEIYNPDNNKDVLELKLRGGILDIDETDSEKYANNINQDEKKREYFESLPFGIRGVTGSDKLVIACEAEESILDQDDRREQRIAFRRHYEITKDDKLNIISASNFLKQVSSNIKNTDMCVDSRYNELVGFAWKQFIRDMKNETSKNVKRKHQIFFSDKLTYIATHDKEVAERAKRLKPFITSRMRYTHQPYKSLAYLHNKIDQDVSMDNKTIIDELEKIQKTYGHIKYSKSIRKPRILYSMMT